MTAPLRFYSRWSPLVSFVQHPALFVLGRMPGAVALIWILARMDAHPEFRNIVGADWRNAIILNVSLYLVGGILLVASWALYLWRCPRVVRRHSSIESYVVEQNTIGYTDENIAKTELRQLVTDMHPGRQDVGWLRNTPRTLSASRQAIDVKTAMSSITRDPRAVAQAYWLLGDGKAPNTIATVWLCLVAGCLAVAYPTVKTLWNILSWLLMWRW